MLHAIAYRRTRDQQGRGDRPHHDPLLPPLSDTNAARLQVEFEEHRLAVSRILQQHVVDEQNRLRVATPPQQLAHFNRSSVAEEVQSPEENDKSDQDNDDLMELYDEQILRLNIAESQSYDIHFPIQRGELNVHKERGGSLQATLSHLERIWSYALEQKLGIPKRELSTHSAVLVVNDVYVRRHLREAMTLLLQRLGFQRCFLVQDSVAATYGAGLGYGCVVDIGAQKTSIACIEDGISQLDARVRLNYGGGDIDQVLLMLLRKCGFPYRECNVKDSYADAHLLDELKERFCHLNANVCGAQEKHFTLRRDSGQWVRYALQVGDEVIMAPLALFHTELFNISSKSHGVVTQQSAQDQYDCEDCFDAEYLRETARRNGVRAGDLSLLTTGSKAAQLPITADDEELIVVDQDETTVSSNSNSQQQPAHQQQQQSLTPQQQQQQPAQGTPGKPSSDWYYNSSGQVVSLDQAVIRAIGRCVSYETRRKMFGTILLVGSTAKMRGLALWLEQRLRQQVPFGLEVNVFTKGMDVGMVAWKGAAIMSVLESARELWITQREWQLFGLRILRERSPFLW